MDKKVKSIFLFSIVCVMISIIGFSIVGCTANERAKSWGGTQTIELPKGQKLQNATWKDNDIWYLTRPMRADEKPETYEFAEQSSYGVFQGTVIFIEVAADGTKAEHKDPEPNSNAPSEDFVTASSQNTSASTLTK